MLLFDQLYLYNFCIIFSLITGMIRYGNNLQLIRSLNHRRGLSSLGAQAAIRSYESKLNQEQSDPSYQLPEETLYVLDGTAMLFNAYYSREKNSDFSRVVLPKSVSLSIRNHLTSLGKSIATDVNEFPGGTLVALVMQFSRFIKAVKPKYVAVAFDAGRKTFRHDLYPSYKENRIETPEEIVHSMVCAPILMHALGCQCFQKVGFEADDVMATLSKYGREKGLNVVHVAVDKDMLQLVDHGVHVMKPKTWQLIGIDEVISDYGIHPNQFCQYQALMGDSSDNIPGVKGIGPKIASALIRKFQSVDVLYQEIGLHSSETLDAMLVDTNYQVEVMEKLKEALVGVKAKPENIYDKLRSCSPEQLKKYISLVTLTDDVELPGISYDVPWHSHATSNAFFSQHLDGWNNGVYNPAEVLQESIVSNPIAEMQNHIFDSLASVSVSQTPAVKFSTDALRYRGERGYCQSLMEAMTSKEFASALQLLRQQYHLLDRE